MKLHLKATSIDLTEPLKIYIDEKLGGIEKFVERWDMEGAVEIWIEVGRTTRHHKKGDVFRAEADLRLPGKVLRAEEEDFDLRVAIDRVRDKLKREIERYKEVQDEHR
ncbi:MAG: ribosome-associated translation inhibitor RaiA [Patescibacteria group bacterium]